MSDDAEIVNNTAAKWAMLLPYLQHLKRGDLITRADIAKVVESSDTKLLYALSSRMRDWFSDQGRPLITVRKVGWRVATGRDHVHLSDTLHSQEVRRVMKQIHVTATAPREELSDDEKKILEHQRTRAASRLESSMKDQLQTKQLLGAPEPLLRIRDNKKSG